uniref:Uncharacterized protein n=1 Tax=Arundo donax TaxID=35708 RepID=A0A0A9C5E6_ARUDO
MGYIRFFSWQVKSLISKKDSFSEDRIPGSSSATTFANLFAVVSNCCRALPAENGKMVSDRKKLITAARTKKSKASPVSASLRTAPAASSGGDCAAWRRVRRGCGWLRALPPRARSQEELEAHMGLRKRRR